MAQNNYSNKHTEEESLSLHKKDYKYILDGLFNGGKVDNKISKRASAICWQ
jgi:hypothetical protein